MNILDMLMQAQNGETLKQAGRGAGLADDQVASAVAALVPALSQGFQQNLSTEGGMAQLAAALAGGDHQKYLDDPSSLTREETRSEGNGILGHLLGSKDVSRNVAAQAASRTGIDPGVLQRLLPLVATMMMGAMSKQQAQFPGAALGQGGGGLLSMLTPLLDRDKDGSAVDDVLGMLGRLNTRS